MARSPFANCRARLQRLKDAKFFAGWVRELSTDVAHITLSKDSELLAGEVFTVQVHGPDGCASFQACLKAKQDSNLVLSVSNRVRILPTVERSRTLVETMTGTLSFETTQTQVVVTDISVDGLGVTISHALERGTAAEMEVVSQGWRVKFTAKVRYCKQDSATGSYRVGLQITHLARLEAARWTRLVATGQAA